MVASAYVVCGVAVVCVEQEAVAGIGIGGVVCVDELVVGALAAEMMAQRRRPRCLAAPFIK